MLFESWQIAEIPGPKKALVFAKPELVVTMIQRAKRPIIVVGHNIINKDVGKDAVEPLMRIIRATNLTMIDTSHKIREHGANESSTITLMSLVDFANRLQDPNWQGIDNKGTYDLVLFIGIPYSLGWLILSSLKHFSSNLTTVSLDRFYQPHATCSFSNISAKRWIQYLTLIANQLDGR